MHLPAEKQDSRLMRAMFGTIAPRYDFFTRAFSYGMDPGWKRAALKLAQLPLKPLVLDLASGTGDFSLLVQAQYPGARPIAVDLTEGMLRLARERGIERAVCGDACQLPFPDAAFDCVFIGYGLRNFPCLATAVREIERIIRPGGVMVSLDFFLPANALLRRLFLAYLYMQGFLFGLLMHGRPRIYTYIPDSLRSFVSIDDFSQLLGRSGYSQVNARGFLLGGIGLHWAAKAE
jgi:demethylmenaquinone methyltransferase/2-methoxy-6-polyprenyl-1,4-benzoquinol methylase